MTAFGARFVTFNRVSKPIDSLLTVTIGDGETLRQYSDRYLELYNEIRGNHENVAARMFKVGLSMGFELRKSLTKNLIGDMQKLRSSRGWRMIRFKISEKQKKLSTIGRTPK